MTPIAPAVLHELVGYPNPFRDLVVKEAFDQRPLPECPTILEPALSQARQAIAAHRPNAPLTSPIVLIVGDTGFGKSFLLRRLVQDAHGEKKCRLMVPISPIDLIQTHSLSEANRVLAKRVVQTLFDARLPGFVTPLQMRYRPIDVLAHRVAAQVIKHLADGKQRLPSNFPSAVETAISKDVPLRWDQLQAQAKPIVETLSKALPRNMPLATLRAEVLMAAISTMPYLQWRPENMPEDEWSTRHDELIALSSHLGLPITFLFDQLEGVGVEVGEPLMLMRGFMQRLLAVLAASEARNVPQSVPLCLMTATTLLNPAERLDQNIKSRFPILPHQIQWIDLERAGFQINRLDHVRDLTAAYLRQFWTLNFAESALRHQRPNDELWPFGAEGLAALHEPKLRRERRTTRDWLLLCQREWHALVTQFDGRGTFEEWWQKWLQAKRDEVGTAAEVEKRNQIDDDEQEKKRKPLPQTPREFLLQKIGDAAYAADVLSRRSAEKKPLSFLHEWLKRLQTLGVISDFVANGSPLWFTFRYESRTVMGTISQYSQAAKHAEVFKQNLAKPLNDLADLKKRVQLLLFLSIGNNAFADLP